MQTLIVAVALGAMAMSSSWCEGSKVGGCGVDFECPTGKHCVTTNHVGQCVPDSDGGNAKTDWLASSP